MDHSRKVLGYVIGRQNRDHIIDLVIMFFQRSKKMREVPLILFMKSRFFVKLAAADICNKDLSFAYCVYSAIISAVIYPIEAHWGWGGGWLAEWGFHDFAGSAHIHMVGGIAALVGAAILGPRIGKFQKNKKGEIKVNAIPGHNLTIGALGCFILWFGWYGFNGAACTSVEQLGSVFLTTTIAPAIATVTCMIFTWLKYGKPDVSMCLNASLAGLVGITAPCDVTDALGATIIGIVSGLLVCFGVWFLDYVLHIDDPVGAVAVHMMNGIWGTIAVGLSSADSSQASQLSHSSRLFQW